MKPEQVKYLVIGILVVALLFVFFYGNSALKEAKKLTEELRSEVDSLSSISQDYEKLKIEYESVFEDLSKTKEGIQDIKNRLSTLSEKNISSAAAIRSELRSLLVTYDTLLNIDPIDTSGINDIRF